MELFGIIFAGPFLLIVGLVHFQIVKSLIGLKVIKEFLKYISILFIICSIAEVLVFIFYGMTKSYIEFETEMKLLRIVNFIFIIPSICNLIIMTGIKRKKLILLPIWMIFGISLIFTNISISEMLYGFDGNGGSMKQSNMQNKISAEQGEEADPILHGNFVNEPQQ